MINKYKRAMPNHHSATKKMSGFHLKENQSRNEALKDVLFMTRNYSILFLHLQEERMPGTFFL